MRRKYSLLAFALASGLALVGCGASDNDNAGDSSAASETKEANSEQDGAQAPSSSELAPEITQKQPEPKQAEMNKPIPVMANGKSVPGAEATVTALTVGEKCEFGSGGGGESSASPLQGNQKLVQLKATVDVKAGAGSSGQGGEAEPVLLDDPTIVDSAGKHRQIISSSYCKVEGSEYQDWIMGAQPGQQTKLYGSWIVPADTKGLIIGGQSFKVD